MGILQRIRKTAANTGLASWRFFGLGKSVFPTNIVLSEAFRLRFHHERKAQKRYAVRLKDTLTKLKISMKYFVPIGLTILLFVGTGCGQTSETTINAFLSWKLNQKHSAENNEVQNNLPTESISYNVLSIDTLSNKTIKLYALDKLLTKADIHTMNQQIKHWNTTKIWDSKIYKFPFITPNTLTDSGKPFLELSIPIFSKNKQICLFKSNINCHQNYCHDELLAIYQKQNATEWKIIKVLHHATF